MKKLLILLLFTSKLYSQTTITQSHVINLIPDLAAKLAKTDSGATYQTKYRSDTGRSNAYIAIAAKGVGTVTSVATSNGITGGTITGTGTISGVNSSADGSTKGVASFTSSDFDATTGNISIDYTNGQAAATGAKGFLTSTDWNTFNNKGTVTSVSVTTANGISGSVATSTTTPAITLALGAITPTTVNGNTFTTGSSTYTGTAGQTYTFPTTTATVARTDAAQTFTGGQTFSTGIATGTTTANLYVPSVSSVGASTATTQYSLGANSQFRVGMRGSTSTVATANNNVFNLHVGDGNFTTAATGTHALAGGLAITTQTLTVGTAAVTDFQNVYIANAPTGGTNNYALNTGILHVRQAFDLPYIAKSASYTLTASEHTVEVTATGQTITLPTAVGITGRIYTIKLTASGSATVGTTSSQTIDASTTYSLASQYKYVRVQSNGANWLIIGNN